jgi:hypothetical protein
MFPTNLDGLLGGMVRSGVGKPMGGYVGPRTVMLKPPSGGTAVKKTPPVTKPKK